MASAGRPQRRTEQNSDRIPRVSGQACVLRGDDIDPSLTARADSLVLNGSSTFSANYLLNELKQLGSEEGLLQEVIVRLDRHSDKGDAYGLSENLRVGHLDKQVLKAHRQFAHLRELSRIHVTLVGDVV